jgi:hypothetical protein
MYGANWDLSCLSLTEDLDCLQFIGAQTRGALLTACASVPLCLLLKLTPTPSTSSADFLGLTADSLAHCEPLVRLPCALRTSRQTPLHTANLSSGSLAHCEPLGRLPCTLRTSRQTPLHTANLSSDSLAHCEPLVRLPCTLRTSRHTPLHTANLPSSHGLTPHCHLR